MRLKAAMRGAVQGVGFRPFVFRLASELDLTGWVNNSSQGVFLEVEGAKDKLEQFLQRLETEKPPRSFIQSLEASWLDPAGYTNFEIRPSEATGITTALVLPDIATCPDCLREIFDPANRRYFYPLTNCTHCGPRFSIIEALPYDRENTSMKKFRMCAQCQAEYEDPRDRRFHAQPNACPDCGPQLELWNAPGKVVAGRKNGGDVTQANREALETAADALRAGQIVAVKGLGGFHLMVAAHDDSAVRRLRDLKHREEKPLAVMFHSLAAVKQVCTVSTLEERLLRSPESPIVLLHRRPQAEVQSLPGEVFPAPCVAPGNPNLGVLLPYTPLHYLLLSLLGFPVVSTSGNLSDEPICIDEKEALERLRGIADLFLVHDRPIVRHVDDSVVRIMCGRELVLRRARGYAPLPITLRDRDQSKVVLAVGAHLKNAVALAVGPQVFVSQHIGDLQTEQAHNAFTRVIANFEKLYQVRPETIACDAHPGYLSTQFAVKRAELVGQSLRPSLSPVKPSLDIPALLRVQHHLAHVLSCMAENDLEPPLLGVAWDGTGYGLDETIWGGEFFKVDSHSSARVAHLRPFPLPGGENAIKEPRRSALGLLHELWGETLFSRSDVASLRTFTAAELSALKAMLARGLNSPRTSSVGRLFDAIASLVGLRQQTRFEGQAAMELEFALEDSRVDDCYTFAVITAGTSEAPAASSQQRGTTAVAEPTQQPPALVLDWGPAVEVLLSDLKEGVPLGRLSAKFHNGLIESIISVVRQCGLERVVLSGGCFQNRYLTERAVRRLREEGLRPYWHQRVPPNDGGIALGQIAATMRSSGRS